MHVGDVDEREAVLAANRAFYEAFERRDFDAMSDAWEHSDAVVCTHPGWRPLHGWAQVAGSWIALLTNSQQLQFIVTGEEVICGADMAVVTCEENLLDGAATGTVAAVNVFRRDEAGRWLLVSHHGGAVAG